MIKIVIDPFCYSQFDNTKTSNYINFNREAFAEIINSFYIENPNNVIDGYASFCKLLFIKNFTDMVPESIEINNETEKFIQSKYKERIEKELPVLERFIQLEKVKHMVAQAKFLNIILYSKEQIQIENAAMGKTDPNFDIDYDYGIIYVKPQDVDYELPMDPITMMRNALGIEHGGSGVDINREEYQKSVEYWSKHVSLN